MSKTTPTKPKPSYTKGRNRVPVTLSDEAMETYSRYAELVHLPLPTVLRQSLEEGEKYIRHLIMALEDENPQRAQLLAKGIQAELVQHIMDANDPD